jgi:hypothetical protein
LVMLMPALLVSLLLDAAQRPVWGCFHAFDRRMFWLSVVAISLSFDCRRHYLYLSRV